MTDTPAADTATAPDIAAMSFEEALDALTRVVDDLEAGSVPLDRSIALYERGEALRRHCEAQLEAAELKVQKIVEGRDGALSTEPFDKG
ncbi:MAG: exodeoxyribonuclease VII small subunit [Pseudomonadota bacterium]